MRILFGIFQNFKADPIGIYLFKVNNNDSRRCSVKTGVLKNFANFICNHLCKIASLQACNFIKNSVA